jgi:uncharacterized protein YqeY
VLRDDINSALKDAMKAADKRRVSTLRLINAAIKDRDIEARGQGKSALSDDDVLALMQKMIKQRQESLDIYEKAGRTDLVTQEREEIDIIAGYLPRQMSDDEARAAIAAAISETGAAGMKDMGKVMGLLRQRHAGELDIAKASPIVKAMLAG